MKILKTILPVFAILLIFYGLALHVKASKKPFCINKCGNKICEQLVCYKNNCVCI